MWEQIYFPSERKQTVSLREELVSSVVCKTWKGNGHGQKKKEEEGV